MAATPQMIRALRRMVADPEEATFTDAELASVLEGHPLVDSAGRTPAHSQWLPSYDLNGAAAELWEARAGLLAGNFDFTADGATYNRRQAYENAVAQARRYRSRAAARSVALLSDYVQETDEWPLP